MKAKHAMAVAAVVLSAIFPEKSTLAAPGDLYVSDILANTIVAFSPDGTQRSDFATGLSRPLGLAFDSFGNLYEADRDSGTIYKFSPDGTTKTAFGGVGIVSGPVGLACDRADNVYVASSGSNRVYKFNSDGTQFTPFGPYTFNIPYGLDFNSTEQLVVADEGFAAGGYYVYEYNADATLANYYGGGSLYQPCAVAVDNADNILVANFHATGGFIERIAPDGTMTTLITGLRGPNGIAIDASNHIYVTEYYAGEIQVYNADGTFDRTFASGLSGPTMLAFAPAVPEPSAWALAVCGMAGLLAFGRFRRAPKLPGRFSPTNRP